MELLFYTIKIQDLNLFFTDLVFIKMINIKNFNNK